MIFQINHYRFNLILSILFFNIICFSLSDLNPHAPGKSACIYFGPVKEFCENQNSVNIDKLPAECTSFVSIGILSDENFTIFDRYSKITGNEGYLKKMLVSEKPSFIHYGHKSENEWFAILSKSTPNVIENAKTEMGNLRDYIGKYEGSESIKGFILGNITRYVGDSPENPKDYTENLKEYINEMRVTFPGIAIGLELNGRELINYYESRSTGWLDLKVLDSSIDFYVLELFLFNTTCTDDFKIGGTTPVTGEKGYTLEKLVQKTVENGIPKEKTYFEYRTSPRRQNVKDFNEICKLTNKEFCASPNLDGWCADNARSYYDKGDFAANHGIGFFAINVDMDDPEGDCGCVHKKYPAFYYILDGFTEKKTPDTCKKLDKPIE